MPRLLALAQIDTQKGRSSFRKHQEMAQNTGRERRMHKGRGERETKRQLLRNGRVMVRRSRPTVGRAGVRMMEAVIWRKGPSYRRTPGADRDLGTGGG